MFALRKEAKERFPDFSGRGHSPRLLAPGGRPRNACASGSAVLTCLRVRSFAIIEALEVELDAGLNIVTGETGAGKSILVDALQLVLGARDPGEIDECRIKVDQFDESTCDLTSNCPLGKRTISGTRIPPS